MTENNNFRKNKTSVYFDTLENAQNINKISKIFANNKLNYELKPNPYLVVIVGSPGVGKTTKAKEILNKEMGLKYEDFYNISLDSLVEKIKPYRNVTKRLYNTLKIKRNELTDKNYALLSEVYLPTIMSKKSNFTLKNTEESKKKKIALLNTNQKISSIQRKKSENSILKSLNELRADGLKYAVMNGLNIIYDTTLTKTKNKLKEDIMPFLELNKNVKYKVIVILVTAPTKNIQSRIKSRHQLMLSEKDPYIRAINPNLTEMFIKDNKEGFDKAQIYFISNNYEINNPNSIYSKNDFTFIEIDNPPNSNKNNNNWKYF